MNGNPSRLNANPRHPNSDPNRHSGNSTGNNNNSIPLDALSNLVNKDSMDQNGVAAALNDDPICSSAHSIGLDKKWTCQNSSRTALNRVRCRLNEGRMCQNGNTMLENVERAEKNDARGSVRVSQTRRRTSRQRGLSLKAGFREAMLVIPQSIK